MNTSNYDQSLQVRSRLGCEIQDQIQELNSKIGQPISKSESHLQKKEEIIIIIFPVCIVGKMRYCRNGKANHQANY